MIRLLLPAVLILLAGFVMQRFAAWKSARELQDNSARLIDPDLTGFTRKLAQALQVAEVPVYIYDVEPVNGLASPDGRIYLTRGFYQQFRSGAVTGPELASVIAHELGHVALGHARRRMIDFSGHNAMQLVLASLINRWLPGIGPMLANLVTRAMAAKLSRSDEYEADAYAAALLTKAGVGTAPQKSLFRKLSHLTGASGTQAQWLASHPETAERIKAIEAMEARWQLAAAKMP